jgi:endonuclease/exonuclease/phosphatase family metal-dependent hydrolase
MRIASFNLENLDWRSPSGVTIEERAEILRPQLERLRADVLCLQEVNGQRTAHEELRSLHALDFLLKGTSYESFHRAATLSPSGAGAVDVHNLVILSQPRILAHRELRHAQVPPLTYHMKTAIPPAPAAPLVFDRPILFAEIERPGSRPLYLFNTHLRAPLATAIPGQKEAPFVWKSVRGWAEGYFLSALKRSAQALDLRLSIDELFDADRSASIAICGDFNAEDHETPLKILIGAEEDTGNGGLTGISLVVLDRALPADRRFSVLHHGRPQMLDHILVSRSLFARFLTIEVHNEILEDEVAGYAKVQRSRASYHAPVVVELALV